MKRILIIQNGTVSDALVTTALLKRLTIDQWDIDCVINADNEKIFQYSKCKILNVDTYPTDEYAIAINLTPDNISLSIIDSVKSSLKMGYRAMRDGRINFTNKAADLHYRARYLGIPSESNIFQLTFGLAGLSWVGDGYDLNYYPRKSLKKNLIGLALHNSQLKQRIIDNLSVNGQLCHVPFRTNILKQIDEINRVRQLITDDETCFHVSLALRRPVEYIIQRKPSFCIETFGIANVHIFKE